MLDNLRLYDYEDRQPLPLCEKCGQECVIGYDETIVIDDSEYYCSTSCLLKSINGREI